jgi:hypothetical protein
MISSVLLIRRVYVLKVNGSGKKLPGLPKIDPFFRRSVLSQPAEVDHKSLTNYDLSSTCSNHIFDTDIEYQVYIGWILVVVEYQSLQQAKLPFLDDFGHFESILAQTKYNILYISSYICVVVYHISLFPIDEGWVCGDDRAIVELIWCFLRVLVTCQHFII